ncbi:Cytochrome c oxidase subunit CcoP [hydrothermal vent metagenome]|uniref:Cytochrome c oxidase subunit CcoP n=1 Tax=hydrothermal vent metagenome TaxID=652676 RepID=A0A3B0Z4Q4_9ZZZZ
MNCIKCHSKIKKYHSRIKNNKNIIQINSLYHYRTLLAYTSHSFFNIKNNHAFPFLIFILLWMLLSACDSPEQQVVTQSKSDASHKKIVQDNKLLKSTRAGLNASTNTRKLSTAGTGMTLNTVPHIDPVLATKGKAIYLQNCVFCHQADAIGKPGVAPSLTNKEFLSIASNKFLYETIRDGRSGTGMPPFKHLGKNKIIALIAYLREHATLPSRVKAVAGQSASHGDPRLGKLFFSQICSTCHGPGGNGYTAGGTGTAIGKRGFLSKVSDGFIRTTIKEGRSNTRMLSFQGPQALADLSSKEIDDIIAYMRTVPGEAAK